MARRSLPSPMGLSMLDLISNSLAAVIILFIILAALRIPAIPPERVKGTLMVRLEMRDFAEDSLVRTEPWVNAPWDMPKPADPKDPLYGVEMREHLFGREIQDSMNMNPRFYGSRFNCADAEIASTYRRKLFSPCAMAYSARYEPNVHYLVFRDPILDIWDFGLTYVDHRDLIKSKVPDAVGIHVWLMTEAGSTEPDSVGPVIAPTSSHTFSVDVKKLRDKLTKR